MEPTAAEYFAARIGEYDSLIRRCVPRYDEMLDRLVEYLPAAKRILELGCGTGNLTLRLAARFPDAELTLVDASPEMLDLASRRLGRAARPLAVRFEDLPDVRCDLVVSSISLHHVADKGALYRRLHALLEPGGAFWFSDQLRGGTDRIHEINWRRWLAFCREPGRCTAEEVQSLLDHADEHDHYTPLDEHFRLLRDAGFVDLDCTWRNWIWGILGAVRKT